MTEYEMENRERLVVLEGDMKYLKEKHDATAKKVDEMHALLMQARGARLAVVLMWASLSALASGCATAYAAVKGFFPRA